MWLAAKNIILSKTVFLCELYSVSQKKRNYASYLVTSHSTPACSMCCVEAEVQHVVYFFLPWCVLLILHHCTTDNFHYHAKFTIVPD